MSRSHEPRPRTSHRLERIPHLSIIIPATDGRPTLERAVGAVQRTLESPDELVIVDRPRNLGPAAARNLGAYEARGDILVFIDADVEVHGDALVRIRKAFDGDPQLAAIFGSYDDDPDGGGFVSDFRNLLHHHVHHQGVGRATTFWAGLGAIRRDVFLELGGFDEERFPRPSVEDIELGMRLHARGHRVLLDPAIQGKHLKRWTVTSMAATDFRHRGVPWLRLILEQGKDSTALNLGWTNRAASGGSLLLVVALVRRNYVLAGSTLALLIALDRRFYRLLWDRRGPELAVAAVPLQIVHRLTSAAAVPVALTAHLFEKRTLRSSPRRRGSGRTVRDRAS